MRAYTPSPVALSSRYGVHVDLAARAVSTPAVLPFPLFCGDGCRVQTAPGCTPQTAPAEKVVASRHSRSAPDLKLDDDAEDGVSFSTLSSTGQRPGGRSGTADQVMAPIREGMTSRNSGRVTKADQSGSRRGGEKWWAQPGGKFAISPELMASDIGLSTSDIQHIVRLRSAPADLNVQRRGSKQQHGGQQHKPGSHAEVFVRHAEPAFDQESALLEEFHPLSETEPELERLPGEAVLKKLQERAGALRFQIEEDRRQGGQIYTRSMTTTFPTQAQRVHTKAANPERGERPRHYDAYKAARQPKEKKQNPFQKYEDKEIKLQQKRRWLSEDPQYLADQISTLHQNRVHLWQDQKDLAEGQPGQAYDDRLFFNASSVHIRKQRNLKDQTENFQQDAKATHAETGFARRVALLHTNDFDDEEDVEYDEERIVATAEVLQSKVKGTATAMKRLKGIKDAVQMKLKYKEHRRDKLERHQHRHDFTMMKRSGGQDLSGHHRDTLAHEAEESLSKAHKLAKPHHVKNHGALTCPQSMALYILKKRLKSSHTSLDKLCHDDPHHQEKHHHHFENMMGGLRSSFSTTKKPQVTLPSEPDTAHQSKDH
eukprot:gnl/MRDRNA2_/MRDRNA2_127363_c0_seq1.p1 gnl/MRDRNA2_/MRDRNA2_127363_c0~~gnl/MRDRNA2_/MRDRNA2_127363_c0_seq1.p1  ORF type:complete len:598 (-),score=125.79 gnl/MRDRNA2_/MRDRNA2_127363_c0_seq1:374-2167(-)